MVNALTMLADNYMAGAIDRSEFIDRVRYFLTLPLDDDDVAWLAQQLRRDS